MKEGVLKHPFFGESRIYNQKDKHILQYKISSEVNPQWFKAYPKYREFQWRYCLFPLQISEEQEKEPIPRKFPIHRISYSGHYVTSLREEILTREKSKAKFAENEILYILYTIACAWRQWKQFCKKYEYESTFTSISSQHLLFNQQGDIKLITPLTSPFQVPPIAYFAPENTPPHQQHSKFWNKSINFSLGLIGSQLIAVSIAQVFYQYKGEQLKFQYEQFMKWVKYSQKNTSKEIMNLVALLTDKNPWIRLKIGEFQAILKPYHSKILEAQQITLNREQSKNSLLVYLKEKGKKEDL